MSSRKSATDRRGSRKPQPMSLMTLDKGSRLQGATKTNSVCPYCAVGCGLNIYTKAGEVIDIEGNPERPTNEGTLCPKGANIFQLTHNPHRVQHVMYRAPYSDRWQRKSLDWAMDLIAEGIKETRERGFAGEDEHGNRLNSVRNMGTLGGAVHHNEENYLIKKLFGAGLGVV